MKTFFTAISLLILCACNTKEINFIASLEIFPNPCAEQVFITLRPEVVTSQDLTLRVIDAKTDNLIVETLDLVPGNTVTVDMSAQAAGEYYAQIFKDEELSDTDIFIKAQ